MQKVIEDEDCGVKLMVGAGSQTIKKGG